MLLEQQATDYLLSENKTPDSDAATHRAVNLSIAISLKRIADAMEAKPKYNIEAIAPDGVVICAFANMELATLMQKDLQPLCGNITLRVVA